MIEPTLSVPQPPKPPLSTRIRSWKWWLYGDMNSQPRTEPPKGFKVQLAFGFVLWIFIGVQPWVSTWLNREVPDRASMQVLEGEIVKTARKAPHIYLKMADGETIALEFPVFLNNLGGATYWDRPRFYLGDYYEKLLGCKAEVLVSTPSFTLWKRYLIWNIQCRNSLNRTPPLLEPDFDLIGRGLLVFIGIPIGFFIIFIRMRRGYYE